MCADRTGKGTFPKTARACLMCKCSWASPLDPERSNPFMSQEQSPVSPTSSRKPNIGPQTTDLEANSLVCCQGHGDGAVHADDLPKPGIHGVGEA